MVQIGEGSDELFFGYPAYVQVLAAARRLWRIQRLVPAIALTTGTRVLNASGRASAPSSRVRRSPTEYPRHTGSRGMAEVEKASRAQQRDERLDALTHLLPRTWSARRVTPINSPMSRSLTRL